MRLLTLLLLLTFLSGCSIFGDRPEPILIEKPVILHPDKPDPMVVGDIEWKVLNRDRLQALLDAGFDDAMMCLSPENYEDLGLLMQEVIRYVEQQNNIIDYYRKTIPSKPPETVQQEPKP